MMWKSLRIMLDLIRFTMLVRANTLCHYPGDYMDRMCVNKWIYIEAVCASVCPVPSPATAKRIKVFSIFHSHFFCAPYYRSHLIEYLEANIKMKKTNNASEQCASTNTHTGFADYVKMTAGTPKWWMHCTLHTAHSHTTAKYECICVAKKSSLHLGINRSR